MIMLNAANSCEEIKKLYDKSEIDKVMFRTGSRFMGYVIVQFIIKHNPVTHEHKLIMSDGKQVSEKEFFDALSPENLSKYDKIKLVYGNNISIYKL